MSGYVWCGCRDCMEIAVGEPGVLCVECAEAGCLGPEHDCGVSRCLSGHECQREGAYEDEEVGA